MASLNNTHAPIERVVVDHSTAGSEEHEVGDDRTNECASDLRGDYAASSFVESPPRTSPRGDDGVEMCAGYRTERQDQRDESSRGGGGVLDTATRHRPVKSAGRRCRSRPPRRRGRRCRRLQPWLYGQRLVSAQQHGRRRLPPVGACSARRPNVRAMSATVSVRSR